MSAAGAVQTRFTLSEQQARLLAAQFGTPLYVVSEPHLRSRIRAFKESWPGDVSYASKANSTLAVIKIAHAEGCTIDVASEGELRAALLAGVPASECRLHGSNKSLAELAFAIDSGIGKIIVDCLEEVDRIASLGTSTPLVLRVAPGVDPKTHAKISTGQVDTKFGFPMSKALAAVEACMGKGLNLTGFHCHVGSQLLDPEAQILGAEAIAGLAIDALHAHGLRTSYLNVGGGLGVRYTGEESPMEVHEYCGAVLDVVRQKLDGRLDPVLGMEPGRAIIAESGVTLYEVGVVKEAASGRVYVSIDGGMSDNPRPALYGSEYELAWHPSGTETRTVTVSGKHCETDTMFKDVVAPVGVKPGDLLEVLSTGAYNSSMASNYNRLPRPATVLLRSSGNPEVVQERETWDDLFRREVVPQGL
ncbi:MAG: diaminopimelate decarboxylase [Armatimonadetes bacterium]|nr:diaminopimelate decarboxylase [Armatimonadota bacterium]